MKRPPPVGTLVAVDWEDITQTCNTELRAAKVARCTTWGRIAKADPKAIVVATSLFETKADAEPEGDFVTIPTGTVLAIRRLKG